MAKDNSLALCIIVIIVVVLFLHYEMGYNFELFNVGGQHNRHHHYPYYGDRFRNAPWHYRYYHAIFPTEPHPQNITVSKKSLFNNYDLDNSGNIEEGEFYNAIDGDLGGKINDKNKYTFTA
tara:strand:- start:391 stop:753 length:363 start_codon:yes stop_codon:yes gene_type:complete